MTNHLKMILKKFIIICVLLPYVGESYGEECDEINQKRVEASSRGSHGGESVLQHS